MKAVELIGSAAFIYGGYAALDGQPVKWRIACSGGHFPGINLPRTVFVNQDEIGLISGLQHARVNRKNSCWIGG